MLLLLLMVGAEPRAFAYRASALPFFDRGSIHKALSDFFQPDLDLCALLEVTLRASCLQHTPPGWPLVPALVCPSLYLLTQALGQISLAAVLMCSPAAAILSNSSVNS